MISLPYQVTLASYELKTMRIPIDPVVIDFIKTMPKKDEWR